MQFEKGYRKINVGIDFLVTSDGAFMWTHQILPDGLEKDDNGDIYAEAGSFIDAEGKVTVPTVSGDKVTFPTPPIGILYHRVPLTHGDAAGSILYKGIVRGDYLALGEDVEFNENIAMSIKEALPNIDFVFGDGQVIIGNQTNTQTLNAKTSTTVKVEK